MSDGICHGRPKISADGTVYLFTDRAGEHHFHTPKVLIPVGPHDEGSSYTVKPKTYEGIKVCCKCGKTVIIDVDLDRTKGCEGPFVRKEGL